MITRIRVCILLVVGLGLSPPSSLLHRKGRRESNRAAAVANLSGA